MGEPLDPTSDTAFGPFWDFRTASLKDKRLKAKDIDKNCRQRYQSNIPSHRLLPDLLNSWIESEQRIMEIRDQIKLPVYILATFMALSLVGLIFAAPIHRSDGVVELSILIAMAGGNIYLLYYLASSVNRFLNHSDEKKRDPK